MAAIASLAEDVDGIIGEIYHKKNQAEEERLKEYTSAVKVQAWFRGQRTRSYLKHLETSATKIQKIWRGFLGRQFFRILLKNTVFIMKLNFFNNMACKIQKQWRGYYIRKYVFNYHSRKRYLEALKVKNERIRTELAEYAEQQEVARKRNEEKKEKDRKEHEARKNHYLVSTEVRAGIYNSPFLPYPPETEMLLRSVRPLSHKKQSKKDDDSLDPVCANYKTKAPTQLPPLVNKPQGPFRKPDETQKQRYKPFQPTLRVCTDFYSLEKARQSMKDYEWVTRINDDLFKPFTTRSLSYEPLLHSTSKYGHLPYGNQFFRHEYLDKNIVAQNFKTLVPPIPIFDKLNDTYSQGQV